MRLKFAFQPLFELRQFLLALRFNLLPQRMLDPSPLLQVTLLEFLARAVVETKAGIAQHRFGFRFHSLSKDAIALT